MDLDLNIFRCIRAGTLIIFLCCNIEPMFQENAYFDRLSKAGNLKKIMAFAIFTLNELSLPIFLRSL